LARTEERELPMIRPSGPLLSRRAFAATAVAVACLPTRLRAAASPVGVVADMRGEVTAELEAHRRQLRPQADLFLGDEVTTAEQSRAMMRLGTDTTLRLGANARLRIDQFVVNAGGVLSLDAGPLLIDKTHGSPGSLSVRAAFGLIAVRGTRVFVGPSNGVLGVFVADGVVDVTAGERSFVLQTGEGSDFGVRGIGIGAGSIGPSGPALWKPARIAAALASVE
jgi:ferric-dicitrate binding protein FerR (iron transport regulator)